MNREKRRRGRQKKARTASSELVHEFRDDRWAFDWGLGCPETHPKRFCFDALSREAEKARGGEFDDEVWVAQGEFEYLKRLLDSASPEQRELVERALQHLYAGLEALLPARLATTDLVEKAAEGSHAIEAETRRRERRRKPKAYDPKVMFADWSASGQKPYPWTEDYCGQAAKVEPRYGVSPSRARDVISQMAAEHLDGQ